MKKKSNGRFLRLFDYNRGDRADALAEDTRPTLKRYFKLLGRRFWKLVSLNLMMLPMILPIVLIAYLYFGFGKTPTATGVLFSPFYGISLIDASPTSVFLMDLFGSQTQIPVYTTLSYVLMGVCVLFLAVTFGWQNIGATYILRSMVRGEPVFLFQDYFYAIKRNLKQGFFLGLIDCFVLFLAIFDLQYFMSMTGSFWIDVMFFAVCAIAILYFFMRFYIYLMQITFELSIRKILKNALIFTMLGIKRNLMALLGIVVLTAVNLALYFLLMPFNIAIPIILPALYYLSFTSFTCAYAAYPIIDRYMIAPYRKDPEEASPENSPESASPDAE